MGQSNWWHKNLSSAVGLQPGNILRICYERNNSVQTVAIRSGLFQYYWTVSIQSRWFNTVRTVSILSGRFQYCLDSFNSNWRVLILSGQFKSCLKTVRTVLKPRRRFRWATIHSLHVVISIFCALILSRSLLVQCSQNSLSSGVGRGVGTGAALPPCPPDLFFLPRCFTWSTTISCCPDSPNLSELHQCPNNFKTVQMVLSLSGWF